MTDEPVEPDGRMAVWQRCVTAARQRLVEIEAKRAAKRKPKPARVRVRLAGRENQAGF
jgi:hypothetical protein